MGFVGKAQKFVGKAQKFVGKAQKILAKAILWTLGHGQSSKSRQWPCPRILAPCPRIVVPYAQKFMGKFVFLGDIHGQSTNIRGQGTTFVGKGFLAGFRRLEFR